MKKIGIYKITNQINQKSYIGQSIDIKERWLNHKSNAFNKNCNSYNSKFYRAVRKYTLNSFEFEILEECPVDKLNEREIYWIAHFDTYKNGYNETLGGVGALKEPNELILNVINDLETTNMTYREIAEKNKCSRDTVYAVNHGRAWFQESRQYPIQNTKKREQERVGVREKRYCVCCGKEIDAKSTRCKHCFEQKREEDKLKNRPAKDVLRKLILELPFTQVAEMYNVSDNAIRKWCKDYELPYKKNDLDAIRESESVRLKVKIPTAKYNKLQNK